METAFGIRRMPRIVAVCSTVGVLMTVGCGLLQILIKRVILGIGNAPSPAFLAQVFACYFVTGFLFALGFHRFGNSMPGKTMLGKAFIYAAVVNVTVFLGNIVNMIAFDPDGLSDLFTPYKVLQYATALADLVNFLIASLYLAALVKNFPIRGTPRKIERKEIAVSMVVGAVLFPATGFGVFQLLDVLFPAVFAIPAAARAEFFMGFWIPTIPTTGICVPLFTLILLDSFKGGTVNKSMKIAGTGFLLYWLPAGIFILPFGYSIGQLAFFLVVMLPPLFIVTLSTVGISCAALGRAPMRKRLEA